MSIQISVTVWTVICFIVLMLVLKNLLFKPVLDIIDKRAKRIEDANALEKKAKELEEEHNVAAEQKRAELVEKQKADIRAAAERIRTDSKKQIDDAKDDRLATVDEYREQMEEERKRIVSELSKHTDELSELFAKQVIKG